MATSKLSVTLPAALHRTALLDAAESGVKLTAWLSGILSGTMPQRAAQAATVRPSLLLCPDLKGRLEAAAAAESKTLPQWAAERIIAHYSEGVKRRA